MTIQDLINVEILAKILIKNNTVDIYIYNEKWLIYNYIKRLTKNRKLTLEQVLLSRKRVCLCLANNNKDKIILNLKNIYYLSKRLSNLINLILFNNHRIYYNNKKEKL